MSDEIVLMMAKRFSCIRGTGAGGDLESVTLPPTWSAGWMAVLRWRVWG
jgi:hypothetical protein